MVDLSIAVNETRAVCNSLNLLNDTSEAFVRSCILSSYYRLTNEIVDR